MWDVYIPPETQHWDLYEPHVHEWNEIREFGGRIVLCYCECGMRRRFSEQMYDDADFDLIRGAFL